MKLTKTTALKASLLLVLAANMSWEKIDLGSVQLAATGTPGSTESVKATGAPATTSPVSVSPPDASVRVANSGTVAPKPQEPSHVSTEPLTVCGDQFEVRYQQFEFEGAKKTLVTATRINNRSESMEVIERTTLIDAIAKKESTLASLAHFIKQQRANNKLSCAGETKVADEKTDEEQKKLEADQYACKVDRAGKALKGEKIVDCTIRELGRVDKRIEKKDSDGKRLSDKQLARNTLNDIQKLAATAKAELRKGLLSKDDMRVEEAQSQIAGVIEAVQAAASEFGDDDEVKGFDKSITKIVNELEALKKASETKTAAEGYKDRASEVKSVMRESYAAVLRDPLNPQLNADYQQAVQEYNLLRTEIGRDFENDELATMKRLKAAHLISGTDYTDFVKPYTDLQKLLREALSTSSVSSSVSISRDKITGSVLGADYAVPTNLGATRTSNSAITSRVLGLTIPTTTPTVTPNLQLQAPRP